MQNIIEPIKADCLVIGGGISGCWTALKLQSRKLKTVLIYYDKNDRGGALGATQLSAGAINASSIKNESYDNWYKELGLGQINPTIIDVVKNNLTEEINQLKEIDELKDINLGLALKSGSARILIDQLMGLLIKKGVKIINNGWVVKINASKQHCNGVQYQVGNSLGLISSGSIVIASGGYSALINNSVKTGTYGSVHGRFLQAGGLLSNMEFIFKHGFGKPDFGELIPTEELPGVEIYDKDKNHLTCLEEDLFNGNGTNSHFQAFSTWNEKSNNDHYIDFKFRDLNKLISSSLRKIRKSSGDQKQETILQFKSYINSLCLNKYKNKADQLIDEIINLKSDYSFSNFRHLKQYVEHSFKTKKFKIKHISYFSLGGILHNNFKTNLKNVFVTGEAMHDFGAHRVGGLPWALYLSSAKEIAKQIEILKKLNQLNPKTEKLIEKKSNFNNKLLKQIQLRLDYNINDSTLLNNIKWVQKKRKKLTNNENELNDSYAYLLVAEAILISKINRKESRGSFYRSDYTNINTKLNNKISITSFNLEKNRIDYKRLANTCTNIEKICY
jgi:succinate dehydrogenase/fumarate reductase flavoprotein subunit